MILLNDLINDAIIYHIYPFGFCNAPKVNNHMVVNRIKVVSDWIPYLKKLKVNVISFTPLFSSNIHGYDVLDFYKIDERLGSNNDFKELCSVLHNNGIKVIMEFPFNYINTNSSIFRDIETNKQNSKYKNWISGIKFNVKNTFKSLEYDDWFGCSYFAKLNLNNKDVINYLIGSVKLFINEFNIDGIKLNEANFLSKNFLDALYSEIQNNNPDLWILGHFNNVKCKDYTSWCDRYKATAIEDKLFCQELPYDFLNSDFDEISNFFQVQSELIEKYKFTVCNYLDNHDSSKIASIIRNGNHLKNLYTLLYTMSGIPAIYYGSEWGLKGEKGNAVEGDFALRPNVKLEDYKKGNISLLEHIRNLGFIRQMSPALRYGSYRKIYLDNNVFVFCRECEWQSVYIVINKSAEYCEVEFEIGKFTSLVELYNETNYKKHLDFYKLDKGVVEVSVEPYSSRIMVAGNDKPIEFINSGIGSKSFINNKRVTGLYKHFKGGLYEVIAFANHTERDEKVVVYRAMENPDKIWVRPENIFFEKVRHKGKIVRRFEYVEKK